MTVTISGLFGLALVLALGGAWAILLVRIFDWAISAAADLCWGWWHRWQWRRWRRKCREGER